MQQSFVIDEKRIHVIPADSSSTIFDGNCDLGLMVDDEDDCCDGRYPPYPCDAMASFRAAAAARAALAAEL